MPNPESSDTGRWPRQYCATDNPPEVYSSCMENTCKKDNSAPLLSQTGYKLIFQPQLSEMPGCLVTRLGSVITLVVPLKVVL